MRDFLVLVAFLAFGGVLLSLVYKELSTPITKEELADFNKDLSPSLAQCVTDHSKSFLDNLTDEQAMRPTISTLSKPRLQKFLNLCQADERRKSQIEMIDKVDVNTKQAVQHINIED